MKLTLIKNSQTGLIKMDMWKTVRTNSIPMMHPTMLNSVPHGMKYHASAGRRLARILRRPSFNANAPPLVFPAPKQQLPLGLSATDMSMAFETKSQHGSFHFDGNEGLEPFGRVRRFLLWVILNRSITRFSYVFIDESSCGLFSTCSFSFF